MKPILFATIILSICARGQSTRPPGKQEGPKSSDTSTAGIFSIIKPADVKTGLNTLLQILTGGTRGSEDHAAGDVYLFQSRDKSVTRLTTGRHLTNPVASGDGAGVAALDKGAVVLISGTQIKTIESQETWEKIVGWKGDTFLLMSMGQPYSLKAGKAEPLLDLADQQIEKLPQIPAYRESRGLLLVKRTPSGWAIVVRLGGGAESVVYEQPRAMSDPSWTPSDGILFVAEAGV